MSLVFIIALNRSSISLAAGDIVTANRFPPLRLLHTEWRRQLASHVNDYYLVCQIGACIGHSRTHPNPVIGCCDDRGRPSSQGVLTILHNGLQVVRTTWSCNGSLHVSYCAAPNAAAEPMPLRVLLKVHSMCTCACCSS
jgi:hypothetical protein